MAFAPRNVGTTPPCCRYEVCETYEMRGWGLRRVVHPNRFLVRSRVPPSQPLRKRVKPPPLVTFSPHFHSPHGPSGPSRARHTFTHTTPAPRYICTYICIYVDIHLHIHTTPSLSHTLAIHGWSRSTSRPTPTTTHFSRRDPRLPPTNIQVCRMPSSSYVINCVIFYAVTDAPSAP